MNIVFLGDSITDAGKTKDAGVINAIGQGYPMLICAKLGALEPMQHTFVNAGINGNRSVDVLARIKADCWNNKPDVVSILLCVNDVTHELAYQNGVSVKRFEAIMRMILEDTKDACPDVKFILMEPYVLPGEATKEHYEELCREIRLRAEIIKKLAEELSAPFIPLQEIFDAACDRAPASYWAWDGVHATPAAHQLIADAWMKAFETIRKPERGML